MLSRQLGDVTFANKSLGEFFEMYNTVLWLCKEESNSFRAPEIPGDFSPIEEEIVENRRNVGIKDLRVNREENSNIINRWMRALHN